MCEPALIRERAARQQGDGINVRTKGKPANPRLSKLPPIIAIYDAKR